MQPPDKNNLLRFLSGQASPDEAERVENWLSESKENRREFDRLWQLNTIQASGQKYKVPDVVKDWQTLKSRIDVPAVASGRTNIRPSARFGIAKSAAVLGSAVVLAAIIVLVVKIMGGGRRESGGERGKTAAGLIRHSGTSVIHDTLTGNTVSILSPNSTVIYGTVNTLIHGEVYIQRPAGEGPFAIAVGEANLLTDGGNFLLAQDSTSGLLRIRVFNGAVRIADKGLGKIITDGQSVVYHTASHRLDQLKGNDPNEIAFATGIYSFQNASLDEIARILAKNYDVAILYGNPALRHCRMTVQFDNLPIKEVLDIIAMTLNLTYEIAKDGKTIQINGQGCL